MLEKKLQLQKDSASKVELQVQDAAAKLEKSEAGAARYKDIAQKQAVKIAETKVFRDEHDGLEVQDCRYDRTKPPYEIGSTKQWQLSRRQRMRRLPSCMRKSSLSSKFGLQTM